MNSTPGTGTGNARPTAPAAVNAGTIPQNAPQHAITKQTPVIGPKLVGYGLPCAKCRTYYAADQHSCPVCKTSERMSATAAPIRATIAASEPLPDPIALEEERERFLQEFQAQVLASQGTLNPAVSRCGRAENHPESPELATVCQGCYDQLQERVDVLEAALHMDVKEAAQIVYDAVWANPADPNQTYQNAANALLSELRKRSGVTPTFRPLQPMLD
jgi:hypothetical protein